MAADNQSFHIPCT